MSDIPLIFHQVAVNVPLDKLFTYHHSFRLPEGTRVVVSFRGRTLVGVVWHADVAVEKIDKILPIQAVLDDGICLPEQWRNLIDFAARYYHHSIGRAAIGALPQRLSRPQPFVLPARESYFSLNENGLQQTAPSAKHHKQAALWHALLGGGLSLSMAKTHHAQAAKVLAQWQKKGWLNVCETPPETPVDAQKIHLNAEQQAACNAILSKPHFAPYLLLGITGSGKTEVYFEAMAQVFAQGRQVLFLLPEINLTPQLLARFQRRFPHIRSVLLHSQTATGERATRYVQAMRHQVSLVIGTRLSVFTPLPDLGLIVVDEEHDASFKQNNELRYHARDLAIWRAKQSDCPIVLGSATPSLESYRAAQEQRYRLLSLPNRANTQARLPEIELDDVARQKLDHGFSARAKHLLQENHRQGGLSLVYLNRRGFAPALFCGDCGYSFGCTHCSAKMVFHQTTRQLRCHHCNAHSAVPSACPQCGNQDLLAVGQGTQRVEETLAAMLPEARIVRVDRDSVSGKDDWQDVYQQIGHNEVDVLVGTQMLAKGHDFARLNLVVVLNADGSLYSADMRAPERLFAELMQVSGRAGRAHLAGRVLIQTQLPNHFVLQSVRRQSYVDFAREELANRREFAAIPWVYAAAIQADAVKLADAEHFLQQALKHIRLPETVQAFGPVPRLMVRLAGRERAQLSLESTDRTALHRAIGQMVRVMNQLRGQYRNLRFFVDVDPQEYA